MAMELMKVGRRGVWLDNEKKTELAAAKTRAAVRDLIEKGVIRRREPRQRQVSLAQYRAMSENRASLIFFPSCRV